MINCCTSDQFKPLHAGVMNTLLKRPSTASTNETSEVQIPRVVIDSDMDNEVDDYFAVVRILLAHKKGEIQVEAMYAAPFSFRHRLMELLLANRLLECPPCHPTPCEKDLMDKYRGQIEAI